jgi:hypothetical protein
MKVVLIQVCEVGIILPSLKTLFVKVNKIRLLSSGL